MAARDAGARAIIPLAPYEVTVTYGGQQGGTLGAGWFGPLQPLAPVAPPDVAGRRFDYPTGYNLNVRPRAYEKIGFTELRALADNFDLLRLVIETRKDQVEAKRWTIRPIADDYGVGRGKKPPSAALIARCKEIRSFFRKPDGGRGWKPWLRELLEQLFVYDAPTLYRRPTRAGGLFGLEVIDGATIVPKIDEAGRIVQYQQQLKGLPAVDYGLSELIYRPRNVRADRVYGFSPVEQILMTVNIALRRQVWQLQYFTEGNIPDSLIGVPETWTPDQIAQFQNWWDTLFEGNTAGRRHAKFVPAGIGKTFIETKNPELFNKQDEWLARVVCFAFSVSPQPFVQMMNRATGETAKESSAEEGLGPTLEWVKDLIDERIAEDFKEPEVEFAWVKDDAIEAEKHANIVTKYVAGGLLSPNEARARIGEEPYSDPIADKLGTITGSGFVPIEVSAEPPADPIDFGFEPPGASGAPAGKDDEAQAGKAPKEDDEAAKEVGKRAAGPFAKRWRRPRPSRVARIAARRAAGSLRDRMAPILADAGRDIAGQVRTALEAAEKIAKADETPEDRERRIIELAARISAEADLSGLDALIDVTAEDLEAFVQQAVGRVLAQIGVGDRMDLVDQVNERAVLIARDRAAELVGKRWVGDELVDNPNALYRIDDATRDLIRRTIVEGLEDNVGADRIAEMIEDLGFSEERAELIARTEIARANSDASLESYRGARDIGINVKKEWLLGDNPCEICQGNADAGAIDVDDEFPSGDDGSPAHPRCECAVSPVVEDDDED